MSAWRPTVAQERWLAVAGRARGMLAPELLVSRSGGWHGARPLARAALFVLGGLATLLGLAILGFDDAAAVVAGLAAAGAAEWFKLRKRLHAGGVEEGLCVAGWLMVAVWLGGKITPSSGYEETIWWFVVLTATGAAAWRLMNPLFAVCAAIALVEWCGSLVATTPLPMSSVGAATGNIAYPAGFVMAMGVAVVALAAGQHEYRRPWHDRALDWLLVVMPLYGYARYQGSSLLRPADGASSWTVVTMTLLGAMAAATLFAALRRRRRAPLLAFAVCVGCLAVEVAATIGGPAEIWLVGYGLTAILLAAYLERRLLAAPAGFTSTRLTDREDLLERLQTLGTAAITGRVSSSGDAPVTAEPSRDGRFGGAGSSGTF